MNICDGFYFYAWSSSGSRGGPALEFHWDYHESFGAFVVSEVNNNNYLVVLFVVDMGFESHGFIIKLGLANSPKSFLAFRS